MGSKLFFPASTFVLDHFCVTETDTETRMANIKSQIKRIRTNEISRLKNKSVRSELKTRVKTAVVAVENQEENSAEAIRLAVKKLDKAASSGVIHKNQAARRKGRLMARLAKISQAQ